MVVAELRSAFQWSTIGRYCSIGARSLEMHLRSERARHAGPGHGWPFGGLERLLGHHTGTTDAANEANSTIPSPTPSASRGTERLEREARAKFAAFALVQMRPLRAHHVHRSP